MTTSNEAEWALDRSFDGEFTTELIDLTSVQMQYTEWNPTAERVLLLVHGFNVQGHTWDPIASRLARTCRVIVPDLRGHGGTSWTREGYWARSFAGDLVELMNKLGISGYDLIGHSLGARISLALSRVQGEAIRQVILSDTGPEVARAGAEKSTTMAGRRLARRGYRSREEALEVYREDHPEWQPVFHALHATYQLRENWAGMFIERADPDLYWITRSAGRKDDAYLWECAESTTLPVTMLWGETSEYVNQELVDQMAARIKNFAHKRFPTGHYIPREMPGEFSDTLFELLGI